MFQDIKKGRYKIWQNYYAPWTIVNIAAVNPLNIIGQTVYHYIVVKGKLYKSVIRMI